MQCEADQGPTGRQCDWDATLWRARVDSDDVVAVCHPVHAYGPLYLDGELVAASWLTHACQTETEAERIQAIARNDMARCTDCRLAYDPGVRECACCGAEVVPA